MKKIIQLTFAILLANVTLMFGQDINNINTPLQINVGKNNGQTSPITNITLNGPNTPQGITSSQDIKWQFQSAGSSLIRSYRGGSWDTYLQFLTTSNSGGDPTIKFHIGGNGNIGIGTVNPLGKFEIASTNGDVKFKIGDISGNSINHISWNTGAAINVPDQGGANPLIYFRKTDYNNLNNFTDVFQIKSDGSVQAAGQVRGADLVSLGTNSWIFHTPDDTRKNMFIAPGIGASDGSAGWDWAKGMVLNNDGSVGISANTVPSGYKLAVGGDIIAERVVVKLTANWPDYVFTPDFYLSTLPEIEKYINQNHHLPNIPSAQEISEKGIDVGLMNIKFMEKIEELTLYLIEQNKKLEALEKKNVELENAIKNIKK